MRSTQSLPDAKVQEEADPNGVETPARPIGPKPAKVVDSNTINLSAFMHFAPKSWKQHQNLIVF